jgi:hypothetical protein
MPRNILKSLVEDRDGHLSGSIMVLIIALAVMGTGAWVYLFSAAILLTIIWQVANTHLKPTTNSGEILRRRILGHGWSVSLALASFVAWDYRSALFLGFGAMAIPSIAAFGHLLYEARRAEASA